MMTGITNLNKVKSAICVALLTAVLSVMTTGCHSSRTGVVSGGGYEFNSAKSLSQGELKELFNSLENSYTEWESMKMPVTLSLRSPKNVSIGGTLSMERNRSIHMSFRFLGMEVASLMVTEDSIYAAYKLERIYFAESIRDLMGGFPATVGNVQDMILGRPFVLGENNVALSQCTLAGNGATWTITPDRSPMSMKGPMAGNTSISAKTSKTTFTGEITLNPRKADWGKGYGKSWTVPKGYARVHAEDIIKKLNAKK